MDNGVVIKTEPPDEIEFYDSAPMAMEFIDMKYHVKQEEEEEPQQLFEEFVEHNYAMAPFKTEPAYYSMYEPKVECNSGASEEEETGEEPSSSEEEDCDSSASEYVPSGPDSDDSQELCFSDESESLEDDKPKKENYNGGESVPEKCMYCDEEFPNILRARLHMKKTHPDFLKLKCGVCNKQFSKKSKEAFINHLNSHRPSKQRLCPHCGLLFKSAGALGCHIIRHNTVENVPCPHCPRMFKSKSHLQSHKKVHENYFCDVCAKKIQGKSRLIEHMRLHITNKTYNCKYCGAKFVRKDNRNTHMKNNHNWVCLVCFGKFKTEEEVSKHVEDHSAQEIEASKVNGVPYEKFTRFQCKYCYRYLASKQSLDFHIERLHEGNSEPSNSKKLRIGSLKKKSDDDSDYSAVKSVKGTKKVMAKAKRGRPRKK